ncbi:MAG TPA: hypothetical protein VH413_12320 [Verrucomicrobiae bacterium]|jgi:hypothetical protein|nr:hypothetical protein [Verrucomicrobiae bacterium]
MIRFFLAALVIGGISQSVFAQTNVIYTTNWVVAPPNYRVVNNIVYDTSHSPFWTNISGRVVVVDPGVVVVENNLVQNVTTNLPERFAIRNYEKLVMEGNRISALAMRVGTYSSKTTNLPLWDCGTNALVPVVKTNEVGPLDTEAIKKDRLR